MPDFVEDGGRWRIGELVCDGVLPLHEGRAWFNVGGRRAFEPREWYTDWVRGAAVGGRWGILDEHSRVILEPRYDGAMSFCGGRAWANVGGAMEATHGWTGFSCEGGRWALVDLDGRERVAPTFTAARAFTAGVAWAKLERWGLLDPEGAWLIPPRFDEVPWRSPESPAFVDGVEPVAVGGRWGLIDRGGAWILEPAYDQIFDLREGIARVADWLDDPDPDEPVGRPGRFGFVDAQGRVLHPPAFSRASDFQDGRAKIAIDGRGGVIDRTGVVTMD